MSSFSEATPFLAFGYSLSQEDPLSSTLFSNVVEDHSNAATSLKARVELIDSFFAQHGAHRPPAPCNYCRRLRLHCLILRTTIANPNPIESCSSCVALYRDCSLAERTKRKAQFFETALPVIGHLHGLAEEMNAHFDEDTSFNANVNVQSGEKAIADDNHDPSQRYEEQQPGSELAAGVSGTSLQPFSSLFSSSYPSTSQSEDHGHPKLAEYKRKSAHSMKRMRVLRHWFAAHCTNPYPSAQEKAALMDQSGLTKTQIANWFANARRRHRHMARSRSNDAGRIFSKGSPMPVSLLAGLSPMERWRNSPPSEEHVAEDRVKNAINASDFYASNLFLSTDNDVSEREKTSEGTHSSLSADSSASQAFSLYHSDHGDNRWLFNDRPEQTFGLDACHQFEQVILNEALFRPVSRSGRIFQCTFCHQSFKKKYDWVRHETSIHLPGIDFWTCATPLREDQSPLIWRMGKDYPECIFCGKSSPTDDHVQSHEFAACEERPSSERTFNRKDHLWQHLQKFHQCRRWEGWNPDLQLLQHGRGRIESECGFCRATLRTWTERVDHLGNHFRNGATMADWIGGSAMIIT